MKVMTIVGTRPEIIKLSRVIAELDARVRHVLVHTGQNFDFELNQIFFEQLEIRKPNHFLDAAGENAAQTIGNVIAKADAVMAVERPDALLLLGDTNSCLAAISAKRRKIPVFHMEAGNRCFDQRVPEEINRRIVDHVSDINLTYTEHARRYLLREGLAPETVIKTGSPMREVLEAYRARIECSGALEDLGVKTGAFFLVSAHREENVDSDNNLNELLASLDALVARYGLPIIFSAPPRLRRRLDTLKPKVAAQIRFLKPLGFLDYVKLEMNAQCVISDSGTITEESSLLGFPAVTIRQTHERPEGMDEGTLIMCGLKAEAVLEAVATVVAQHAEGRRPCLVADYDVADVSSKIVRIILSYTEYVNRTVWFK